MVPCAVAHCLADVAFCPAAKKLEQAEKQLTATSAAQADLKVSAFSP